MLTPTFSPRPFYIMTLANFFMEAIDIYGLMFEMHSLRIVSLVLRNIYYVIPFVSAFNWTSTVYQKYKAIIRQTPITKWIGILGVDEYAGFFSLSLTLVSVLFQAFQPLYGNANGVLYVEDYTPSYVIAYTLLMVFSTFIGSIIPNRIFNYKAYILRLELENKRELVKHAAHEIRTPLNTIGMGLSLLEKGIQEYNDSNYLLGLVKDIEESNALAVGILTDLLNYEKIASKQMHLDLCRLPPIPFFTKVLRPFYLNARAKNIELKCNYDEVQLQNVLINIDEGKMGQVFRNLVSNAIKFSEDGGTVNINIRLRDCEWLRVEVEDSGPGVCPEDQRKLFHEVAQFNPNANQGGGGSGVGLWISKKIVDMHGARISIRSELGVGSTFTLDIKIEETGLVSFGKRSRVYPDPNDNHTSGFEAVLPLPNKNPLDSSYDASAKIAVSNDHLHTLSPIQDGTAILPQNYPDFTPKYCILIVDDSKVNRVMLSRILTSKGHTCFDACDGAVAVQRYEDRCQRGESVDVVLMDSHMPNMSGSEAAQKLRQLGFTGIIVGVTGDVVDTDDDPFLRSGVDGVVTKPIDANKLEDILHTYIKNKPKVSSIP